MTRGVHDVSLFMCGLILGETVAASTEAMPEAAAEVLSPTVGHTWA